MRCVRHGSISIDIVETWLCDVAFRRIGIDCITVMLKDV
jgi:hypothetical protein